MNPSRPPHRTSPVSDIERAADLCQQFEAAWAAGARPRAEEFLADRPADERDELISQLVALEVTLRRRRGDRPAFDELMGRFGGDIEFVRNILHAAADPRDGTAAPEPERPDEAQQHPKQLLRYRVTGVLGSGGFGIVYAAFDDELRRPVAIKVLHRKWVTEPAHVERYLEEARALARLDHPSIVPVYDVGRADDGRPLMVSKFVEGSDLAARIRRARPGPAESARLLAAVADALHHAHLRGLVHRDVKPGNILIDDAGRPHVADFGLVLREEEFGTGPTFAGTPDYMSPEQARGEGHRVDGRSDVFSLGVVLYELLTGRRPFRTGPRDELLDRIVNMEPRPPRQVDDAIPKELERVCLKAMAKSAAQRYTTARDLADDLRAFVAEGPSATPTAGVAPVTPPPATPPADSTTPPPVKVLPKGLRSFDAADADFFLELLPGPRDREGVPESLRFWQRWVLEADGDRAKPVGLIYGPSGCGKSSLVKAGLLPRLPPRVVSAYVEATPEATEERVLARLRRLCPSLPAEGTLAEAVTDIRRGRGTAPGEKVLIVLDQFEQWLQARNVEANAGLVRALRQCDGTRVQALILVRDDFWMAVTRLMRELEQPIAEGENAAAVDLFDFRHARKVLAMLGRAYGALPETPAAPGAEQNRFLDQAVAGLAQDSKVIPVRLALFSEMVKARPWEPATLKAIGGIEGVGVAFLEESFGPTSPPAHRTHAAAARAVLAALLPGHGKDIKGTMRSHAELLAASGYADRPAEFEALLRILHKELRLVSPSDAEGVDLGSTLHGPPPREGQFYQLTHDYLVPALREWLTRRQKQTRRGRAEIRLAECADRWSARPTRRNLPSLFEWASIRLCTRCRSWTPAQRALMRRAARLYGLRAAGLAIVFVAALLGGRDYLGRLKAVHLRDQLLSAPTIEVPTVVAEMTRYRHWVNPLLYELLDGRPDKELHVRLALLPSDRSQAEPLFARLLTAQPQEFVAIRNALEPQKGAWIDRLWAELEDMNNDPGRRLRSAGALAAYAPGGPRWEAAAPAVAAKLVTESPFAIAHWSGAFQPAGECLLRPLAALIVSDGPEDAQRRSIKDIYQVLAEGQPDGFQALEEKFADTTMVHPSESSAAFAKRRAIVGSALIALGQGESVWPHLRHSADPTLRSQLIERLGPGGVQLNQIELRLNAEPADKHRVRHALILALGGFNAGQLSPADHKRLAARLLWLYENDPDPGIHGAAGWVLQQWMLESHMFTVDSKPAARRLDGRRWFVTSEGQVMALISGGVDVSVSQGQLRRLERVVHAFAISAREVTVDEFMRCCASYQHEPTLSRRCPVSKVSWFQAAKYCNWLSEREGLDKVYLDVPGAADENPEALKIAPDWRSRNGYRLPTHAEWVLACAAGADTAFSCGDADDELLGRYAVYMFNSYTNRRRTVTPVGTRKPNDFGLFDMHGNVWEWCHDQHWLAQLASTDPQGGELVLGDTTRVVIGASFDNSIFLASHNRSGFHPAKSTSHNAGIRLVRSIR